MLSYRTISKIAGAAQTFASVEMIIYLSVPLSLRCEMTDSDFSKTLDWHDLAHRHKERAKSLVVGRWSFAVG